MEPYGNSQKFIYYFVRKYKKIEKCKEKNWSINRFLHTYIYEKAVRQFDPSDGLLLQYTINYYILEIFKNLSMDSSHRGNGFDKIPRFLILLQLSLVLSGLAAGELKSAVLHLMIGILILRIFDINSATSYLEA